MTTLDPLARAAALSFWSGPVEPIALKGGITNANFEVRDRGRRFFVRIGDDIPVHGVMRFAELAASRAAHAAGLAPAVLHHEPGIRGLSATVVHISRDTLIDLAVGDLPLDQAVSDGRVRIEGDSRPFADLLSMLDRFEFWFAIVEPGEEAV